MNCTVLHESRGRIRIHIQMRRMSIAQADQLEARLSAMPAVRQAQVFDRTCDAVILYEGTRETVLQALAAFRFDDAALAESSPDSSSRALNRRYQEKLVGAAAWHFARKLFFPSPLRTAYTVLRGLKFLWRGLRCLLRGRLEVEVLDAASIGASILRGDFSTAASVMFLLQVGELMEEWTRKKSVGDLARSLSLNVDRVWLKTDAGERLIPIEQIRAGDEICVHSGSLIPLDGKVVSGEASVNQASLTGESLAVLKSAGATAYAGTAVEDGECVIRVDQQAGSGRYDQIVAMIERSERLKSNAEVRALALADRLVPYSLMGTLLTYLLTLDVTRSISILMVDYSCALKLAMPLAALSAMRECGSHHITVKGGKYLEAVARADTIVFDKTGTLTYAVPCVAKIIPFSGHTEETVLRVAACLEEHFPHSMANAVVQRARELGITHEEMHSKVEYVVAHGISSCIDGEKAIIGSQHFVFGDEGCVVPPDEQERFDSLPAEFSHLYLAIGGVLAGVVCIADPLRQEASAVLNSLRKLGVRKAVMMTGDNERTAAAIAAEVGVDAYRAGVLPEDKAHFVEAERAAGHTVIMVGDGINDSPALSASDVGIAISEGAAIAREIADITIAANDLYELVLLRMIAMGLQSRTAWNYRFVISFNSALIALGALGVIQPTASALLHNLSTLGISLQSMTNLLK